jgi:lipopolysaccharide transport system ATP-binding protein
MTIELSAVTVDLPIYSSSARSLRRSLTKATVGGALFSGAGDRISVRALSSVNLKIRDGDRVGLIGGNGAGKDHASQATFGHLLANDRLNTH